MTTILAGWESKVLEALQLENGVSRVGRLAQAVHGSTETVSRALEELQRKGLAKRKNAWWTLTASGGAIGNGNAEANPDGVDRRSTRMRTGIDYAIVLEDLKARRSQLDAAIEAIEGLQE